MLSTITNVAIVILKEVTLQSVLTLDHFLAFSSA